MEYNQKTTGIKIQVDTTDVDKAIRKVKKLIKLLKKANHLADSLKKGLET